jgi:hypothetical protein
MSNDKIKLYKNSARNMPSAYKPYVPQYQVLGLEPEEYKSAPLPSNVQVAQSNIDNPRTKKAEMRQPLINSENNFAPANYIPNVGNNMEKSWASIDGQIIDDLEEVNFDSSFIDNNDYISEQAFGSHTVLEQPQLPEAVPSNFKKNNYRPDDAITQSPANDDLLSIIQDLSSDSYLLIVNGVSLCSGPLEEIQDQSRALVFGDHQLCDGNPIPVEDLIIVKRVAIKIGLFLE